MASLDIAKNLLRNYGGNEADADYWAGQIESGVDVGTLVKNMSGQDIRTNPRGFVTAFGAKPEDEDYWSGQITSGADLNTILKHSANYESPGLTNVPVKPPAETPGSTAFKAPSTDVAGPLYKSTAPEETVEKRLTGLLAKESPYRTLAETQAKQEANRRGLLNSAMAVTAGESAAIQNALPIAQQDAAFYQNRNLAGQQGEINSALSGQQAIQQAGLYGVQGNISSQLNAQQNAYDWQKTQYTTQADTAWKKLDLETRAGISYAQMDADKKAKFDATINTIGSEYQRDYLEIMVNPNFETPEDRQAAINVLNANTKNRYDLAASMAGVTLDWSPPGAEGEPEPEPNPDNPEPGGTDNGKTDYGNWWAIEGATSSWGGRPDADGRLTFPSGIPESGTWIRLSDGRQFQFNESMMDPYYSGPITWAGGEDQAGVTKTYPGDEGDPRKK